METDNMLRELYRLKESQLGYDDYTFISSLADRTRMEFDTSILRAESRAEIVKIHAKHFLSKQNP